MLLERCKCPILLIPSTTFSYTKCRTRLMHYLPRGTFLAPLAGPLGRLPPKCETQSGTDCRPFANFSKIRSAVSEEMHRKQTNSNLNVVCYQGGKSLTSTALPQMKLAFLHPDSRRVKIIIIIPRLIMRAMSEYMTKSDAWAVARWDGGSCLMMVRKTKQVGFEPVFESLHCGSISYGGWDFIPNLAGTVAEGTPTKVSCYSWNTERLVTGQAQG